jgi:hypothetical protein
LKDPRNRAVHPGIVGGFPVEGHLGDAVPQSRGRRFWTRRHVVEFKNVCLSGLINNFGMHGREPGVHDGDVNCRSGVLKA